MTRLARLTRSALVAGMAVVSCARAPEAGLEDQAARNFEFMPGWLDGKARFQPLMRCEGVAAGAVFLFPSGLRSEASTLPRPGIPLEGLQLRDWGTL